jgi:hypothetical protein
MFIELLTAAKLMTEPLIEVRSRRYSYRSRHYPRPRIRVAPFSENVNDHGPAPHVEPSITILKTIITTGQDTFRARWEHFGK